MLKDRSRSRSQRPAALFEGEADPSLGPSDPLVNRASVSHHARAQALLALYVLLLDPVELTFLRALLGEPEARKLGADKNPREVFDEFERGLTTFAPHILAGKLPGFGPRRARFGAELLRDTAAPLDTHAAAEVDAKVATTLAAHAITLTRPAQRRALCAVRSLLANHSEARTRLAASAPAEQSRDAKLRRLEEVVREIESVRTSIPASLLADAGLSPAVLDALAATATAAVDAHRRQRSGRQTRTTLRGELTPAVGRMVFELRQLMASVREARRGDPTLPAFSSKFVGAQTTTAKPAPPAPVVTPPAPVPPAPAPAAPVTKPDA